MGDRATRDPAVTVSVLVPVWNVEPWLPACLDSVLGQTIGSDRLELIAVDDGSTDRSGAILDAYAADSDRVRVVHQPNSGGPGGPRNTALALATGTYVFFLDADDFLGPEALERLVAMAERNGSDIVLGRIVGVDGRRVYRSVGAFRRNVDRADVELVYPMGNVLKLFRRSMLERAGLRFRADLPGGEDGDFMARAYLEAGVISVVADYDCYFARRRDGSQTRRADRHDDLGAYLLRLEADRIRVTAARRRRGVGRDLLVARHLQKVAAKFGSRWRALDADERRRVFDIGAGIVDRWSSPLIERVLPAWARLRLYCLGHGLAGELDDVAATSVARAFRRPVVDQGRVYARFPHFRDSSGIPDRCFDITDEVVQEQRLARLEVVDGRVELAGESYLRLVGGTTSIELRRWPRGEVHPIPVRAVRTPDLRDRIIAYPLAGFEAVIDPATAAGGAALRPGVWTLWIAVEAGAARRCQPLRLAPGPAAQRGIVAGEAGALAVSRTPGRALRLRVGPPRAVDTGLERVEAGLARLGRGGRRLGGRMVRATRAGRLAGLGVEAVRPDLAERLSDDD